MVKGYNLKDKDEYKIEELKNKFILYLLKAFLKDHFHNKYRVYY